MKTVVFIFLTCFVFVNQLHAQPKFGAIGDSLTDEHFDQSGFGTNLGYSHNALELMVLAGKIDVGPTGNWGGTRGTGYEYNWALAGATTDSLIATNQHVNLANQIPTAGISKAIMLVGSNNLFPYPPDGMGGSSYEAIYEGLVSQSQINQLVTQAVNEVVLAAQTVKASGVDLVVGTSPDYGISPLAKHYYPDPVKRELVDNVMETFNLMVRDRMVTDLGVPVLDTYQLTKDVWGDHGSENATFELGGVQLDLNGTGGVDFADVLDGTYDPSEVTSDTVDAFVHDGIHPNSVVGGVFANLWMTAFNEQYGDNFQLFTEEEILQNAGPNLGSMYTMDTFSDSLGGKTYSDYVYSPVPEPGSAVLLVGLGAGLAIRRRRAT